MASVRIMRFRPALACAALASAAPAFGQSHCPSDPGVCGAVLGGLAFGGGAGSAVGASWAQPTAPDVGSGRIASPPSQDALDRLRLAQEWYTYVPLIGPKDGLALVQVLDDELVVAQTRSGLVVGLDARTGAKQWAYRLPAAYAAAYPVAVAGRFVFVANLATLVCLQRLTGQVQILYRRAKLIQLAIILGATSVLFAAVLIITLFFTALLQWDLTVPISVLFMCCLAALIGSLIAFILDIRLSLKALKLELGHKPPTAAA